MKHWFISKLHTANGNKIFVFPISNKGLHFWVGCWIVGFNTYPLAIFGVVDIADEKKTHFDVGGIF